MRIIFNLGAVPIAWRNLIYRGLLHTHILIGCLVLPDSESRSRVDTSFRRFAQELYIKRYIVYEIMFDIVWLKNSLVLNNI